MIAGHLPYKNKNMWAHIENVTSDINPLPPSKANPKIAEKLDDIIMKCLAKNKEERYQSISDLIRDLEGRNE